ncbi:MAG: hypothetical protein JNK82_43760 [Myxococcaceae bacterium]|nr:hypothetical protein [Myxococcaceae bacterium]
MLRFPVFALIVVLAACSGGSGPECRTGADCASGTCTRDGLCAVGGAGGGSAGGAATAGGTGGGTSTAGGNGAAGGTTATAGGMGTGGGLSPTCLPNHDGTITRMEVPLQVGLHATFKVATGVTFSSAPVNDGGTPTWDMTKALSGDRNVLAETQPLTGKWFESEFPGATYVTQLAADDDLLGVFEVKTDGLYLRGVADPQDSLLATRLTYTPPAKLVAFPLRAGDSWSTTCTVQGTYNGSPWIQYETYAADADTRGVVKTPFADFDAIRVKTRLTRTVGGFPNVTRSQAFVTECFGTIATLRSQLNETSEEFTSQAEVRRLSP